MSHLVTTWPGKVAVLVIVVGTDLCMISIDRSWAPECDGTDFWVVAVTRTVSAGAVTLAVAVEVVLTVTVVVRGYLR